MYNIEKTDYGFRITLGDFIKADEMAKWVSDSKKALAGQTKPFSVFVDMRGLKPLPDESQKLIREGQKLYKEKGMQRSVVILNSAVTTIQFRRIAKETGIYQWERYVDASSESDWEKKGLDWVKGAADPDA